MAIIQNLKNNVYLAIKIRNILVVTRQLLASPPDPHRGSAPGPRWGTSVPQTPSDLFPWDKFLPTPLVFLQTTRVERKKYEGLTSLEQLEEYINFAGRRSKNLIVSS